MRKLLGILGSEGCSKTIGAAIVNATTLGECIISLMANDVVAAVGTEVCYKSCRR